MNHSTKHNVTLVGCGKMGTAMIQGWSNANLLESAQILEPQIDSSKIHDLSMNLQSLLHVKRAAELDYKRTDIVILAVKPQIMDSVCEDLRPHLPDDLPVLSIAAGKNTAYFKQHLTPNTPIIRTMPNTPAAIGKGISALYATDNVKDTQKQMAQDLLNANGQTLWLNDEAQMDAVTAVSGSGPAYVFYLIEAMASAGVKQGIPEEQAMQLARQTIIGAGALLESERDTDAATLRKNVTSPGGTTEAALNVLMNGEFQDIIDNAIEAATKRGKELS